MAGSLDGKFVIRIGKGISYNISFFVLLDWLGKSKQRELIRRMEDGENGTSSIAYQNLPEDVIIEILLRLPVNSLLKFKSVCRNWYSLIKSPNFIRKHMNHRPTNLLVVHHYNPPIADKYVYSLKNLVGIPLYIKILII